MPKRSIDETTALSEFSHFKDFYGALVRLESLAMPENWKYKNMEGRRNQVNPILENYLHHTFRRLFQEYKNAQDVEKQQIIYTNPDTAIANTGLFTPHYDKIFAVFHTNKSEYDERPYFFFGFCTESDNKFEAICDLPRRANYFDNTAELIYDTSLSLRCNYEHILNENRDRFPDDLKESPMLLNIFSGAVEIAKKRVEANYKAAVPNYFGGEICLLLPLCLHGSNDADLALAIKRNNGFYSAKTCLTLDMAYNDARLIARPDVDWLKP